MKNEMEFEVVRQIRSHSDNTLEKREREICTAVSSILIRLSGKRFLSSLLKMRSRERTSSIENTIGESNAFFVAPRIQVDFPENGNPTVKVTDPL